jgi:hypothetical protein
MSGSEKYTQLQVTYRLSAYTEPHHMRAEEDAAAARRYWIIR